MAGGAASEEPAEPPEPAEQPVTVRANRQVRPAVFVSRLLMAHAPSSRAVRRGARAVPGRNERDFGLEMSHTDLGVRVAGTVLADSHGKETGFRSFHGRFTRNAEARTKKRA
ncbi:hypothetical protein GCM10010524_45810 [Streptomyces mexicanus]